MDSISIKDSNGVSREILATLNAEGVHSITNTSIRIELAISMGLVDGYSTIDKFGENPTIDTGSTPEDLWEVGGLYIYDADGTAPIVSLISDNPIDEQDIRIVGLDINGDEVDQTITLQGNVRVPLTTPLWRVYRLENISNVVVSGNVFCYIGTGGIPVDADKRALINDGNNQTLMCIYTIPKGKVGFLYRGELGSSRANATGEARAAYYSRRLGKVFKVKKRVNTANSGSSIYQDERSFPDVIPSLTDIKLTVESVSANNMGMFGTFDIMLVDETKFSEAYLIAIGQPGH